VLWGGGEGSERASERWKFDASTEAKDVSPGAEGCQDRKERGQGGTKGVGWERASGRIGS
jgi:hypothetical protein